MLKTREQNTKQPSQKPREASMQAAARVRGELPLWVLPWPVLGPPPTLPAMGRATQELHRPWGGGNGLCCGLLLCWGLAMLWGAHHGQELGSRRDHGLCLLVKKQQEGCGGSRSEKGAERSRLQEDAG